MSVQLDSLPEHDHVCVFYRDDKELEDLLASYMGPGLRQGQKCFLMAPNQLSKQVFARLENQGIVCSPEQWECLPPSKSYLRVAPFQSDRMIRFLDEKLSEWTTFWYCRLAGETSWAWWNPTAKRELFEYEDKLNHLHTHPGLAIFCFYDLRILSGYDILNVLKAHPRVLFRGILIDNPYYKNPSSDAVRHHQDLGIFLNLFGASLFNLFLSGCTRPEQLAQMVTEALPGIFPVSTCVFAWVIDRRWQLEGLHENGPIQEHVRAALVEVADRIRDRVLCFADPLVPLKDVLDPVPAGLGAPDSLYVSPIRSNKSLYGFLLIRKKDIAEPFDAQEIFLLSLLLIQAGITIENIYLERHNQRYIQEIRDQQQEIAKQNELLKCAEAIHRQLTEKVLNGEGIESIAGSVSQVIGKPVTVYNQYRCIAAAGLDRELDIDYRDEAEFAKFIRKINILKRVLTFQDRLLVAPIIVEHAVLGYVCVHCDERPSTLMVMAAEHAATAIAVEMLKMKVEEEVKHRLKTGLVDDLISGHIFNEEGLLQKAGSLGYDLSQPHIVVVGTFLHTVAEGTESERQRTEEKVLKILETELSTRIDAKIKRPRILLAEKGEQFVFLVPSKLKQSTIIDSKNLSNILRKITEEEPNLLIGIGTESPSLAGYAASYRKAMRCIQVARRFRIDRRCLAYEDLGIWRLLSEMSDEQLLAFSRETLGALLDTGQKADQSLLETLEAYFNHNGCLKDAADALFVHVGTVKYRMQKVSSILNCDLRDAHTRMTLQAALLIQRLFGGGMSNQGRQMPVVTLMNSPVQEERVQ